MHLIVIEITLLIMEIHGKIMELCFEISVGTLLHVYKLYSKASTGDFYTMHVSHCQQRMLRRACAGSP